MLLQALTFVALAAADGEPPAGNPQLTRPPRVVEITPDTLPEAELLGTPAVRVLLGYTRRALHLHDGHTMALFSYGGGAPANWLFLIDGRDLSSERHAIPNNDIASHGAALGADGNIYIMPYRTARAYRFDTRVREFQELETDLPENEYTWDALGASNGCIYFGTYPSAYFGEYDPADSTWALWKQVAPESKYVTGLSEDKNGRIRFKAWGPGETWLSFDPKARAFDKSKPQDRVRGNASPPLPDPPPGDRAFRGDLVVDGRRFAIGFPSGRLWEIATDGTATLRGDTGSPAEPRWWLKAMPGALAGASYFGATFRFDLETGSLTRHEVANRAPGGNAIMFIESVTPRCVVGANYSQQNLFKIDPETGVIEESPGMVARVTGEPMCAVGHRGKAYLGIYVDSLISVFDPEKPFSFGSNPRELVELGSQYAQTRPRAAVTDGRLVYISSDSAYNHLGGALAVIDPATEQIDVYHHLIRDQNLPTLAWDPATRLLWGGTDRWGQMRSHPPTQESAVVYAFDPDTREVAATLTPWPGADMVSVLGVGGDGVLIAANGNDIALVDTRTRETLYKGTSPIAAPRVVRRGADGFSYCLSEGRLFRWDLRANETIPVAHCGNCTMLTEPSPGCWLLADSASVYRVRVAPTPHN